MNVKNKSKTKGKRGERDISEILKNIFNKNFIRVPNSGAFVGGKNVDRKNKLDETQIKLFEGDIIIPDGFREDVILEIKFYKKLPIDQLIYNEIKYPLKDWLDKYFKDNEKNYFLCIKQNYKPWLIIFDEKKSNKFNMNYFCKFHYKEKNFYILNLVDFFKDNYSFFIEPSL